MLRIKARKDTYELSFGLSEQTKVAGTMPSSALVPLFTGVHLGLYAQGANETPSRQSAYFKYARWTAA